MEANAPENIYVCIPDDDIVGTASTQKGFPHQFVTEEYTRTDAFVEKAVQWLKEQNEMIGVSFQEDFLERFKNYMEG